MADADGDEEPVPGLDPWADAERPQVLYAVDVDGELFHLRPGRHGGTDYEWVTGPHEGYGFGTSASPDLPVEAHRQSIRGFLAMIDPATGYIAED
ncbi:MAG: hypothetical protein ABR549_08525 [Mycobacteriales bacterium]